MNTSLLRPNKLDRVDIQKMAILSNAAFPALRLDNFHVLNIMLFEVFLVL